MSSYGSVPCKCVHGVFLKILLCCSRSLTCYFQGRSAQTLAGISGKDGTDDWTQEAEEKSSLPGKGQLLFKGQFLAGGRGQGVGAGDFCREKLSPGVRGRHSSDRSSKVWPRVLHFGRSLWDAFQLSF